MAARSRGRTAADPLAEQVDAALLASRVLVAVSAQSIAAIEDEVSLLQLRALVVIASLQPVSLARFADAMGVHASNATRTCDRLVSLGLIDRQEDPGDRRRLTLELTPRGRQLVTRVMNHRRTALEDVLRRMPAAEREALPRVLGAFAAAAGEVPAPELWSMGWTADASG